MKTLERLILLAGVATILLLLWHFNPRQVWGMVSRVGIWGLLAILSFQICDHTLNALGWRMAFPREDARGVPLWLLIKGRLAGDGVNYLTPSGQIVGELVRPGMLGKTASEHAKNSSVVIAKLAQTMGQALFILLGLLFVLQGKLDFLKGRERDAALAVGLALFCLVGAGLWCLACEKTPRWLARFRKLEGLRSQSRSYLREHPGRYLASVLFFMAGYGWGGLETLLICHFMRVSVGVVTAFAMEILSNLVDAVMFMVPAKMGTQEAGKTAIFRGFGYPGSVGLAFGLIRHLREFAWASAGFSLYAANRRAGKDSSISSLLPQDDAALPQRLPDPGTEQAA